MMDEGQVQICRRISMTKKTYSKERSISFVSTHRKCSSIYDWKIIIPVSVLFFSQHCSLVHTPCKSVSQFLGKHIFDTCTLSTFCTFYIQFSDSHWNSNYTLYSSRTIYATQSMCCSKNYDSMMKKCTRLCLPEWIITIWHFGSNLFTFFYKWRQNIRVRFKT